MYTKENTREKPRKTRENYSQMVFSLKTFINSAEKKFMFSLGNYVWYTDNHTYEFYSNTLRVTLHRKDATLCFICRYIR